MENMTEFQKNLVRMWDSLRPVVFKDACSCGGVSCDRCPFKNTVCHNDDNGVLFNAEKAIEIVTQWAKEHPIVTRADKFKEVFGVEPKSNNCFVCPHRVGFNNAKCNLMQCAKCTNEFWNSEYKEPKKEGDA